MSKITLQRSNVKVELDTEAFNELRRNSNIVNKCKEEATRRSASLCDGYKVESRTYPDRAGAAIVVRGSEAYKDNLENNSLLKAVGKG